MNGELLDEFAGALKRWRIQKEFEALEGWGVCWNTESGLTVQLSSITCIIGLGNLMSRTCANDYEVKERVVHQRQPIFQQS